MNLAIPIRHRRSRCRHQRLVAALRSPVLARRARPRFEWLEDRTVLATFLVTNTDDSGPGSLRQAILEANDQQGAAEITFDTTAFATPQTITLTSGQLELSDTTGATTITGPAAGVTVNAVGASRVFQVDRGVTASISGMTITGGRGGNGAGLYNAGGNLTLTDGTVTGNSVASNGGNGGGVYTNAGGRTTLTDCTVSGNSATYGSGVSSNYGLTLTLTNCTITGNAASGGSYSNGAGVDVSRGGTATLTDCTITGNSAPGVGSAAGMMNFYSTATLTDCTISGNSAGAGGGGQWSFAGNGGGLANYGGTTTLTNCTISGNSARESGGGLVSHIGTTTLTDCTVSDNSASYGGGLSVISSTIHIGNSIVAGNTATSSGPDASGTFASEGNNLIGKTDGSSGWIGSDLTGTMATPLDSGLAPLGDYGGPTQTVALLPGSPAVDAGNNALVPAGIATDQRGYVRIYHGTVDIGAFELLPPPVSIAVSPSNLTLAEGVPAQFTAMGTFPDGETLDITDSVTWVSATPAVATISGTGVATALVPGTSAITASLEGVISPGDTLTVSDLVSIAVSPGNPDLAQGVAAQFTATGTFADGSTLDITHSVTWASATPAVATISGTGVATALAPGTSAITASLKGVTSPDDTLTVIAPSFVVNTTADELGFFDGTTSLREAIAGANVVPGQTITFALPAGSTTIHLLSPLPAITVPVLIDGFSQPGYSGSPLIEIDGSQAGTTSGLTITGAGVTVRGLDIYGFLNGAGILIAGPAATGNVIEANNIGTDPTGTQALPDDFGIDIVDGARDNTIGGATAADGNLIAFNSGPGVEVEGNDSVGNQITANRIVSNDDVQGGLQFDGNNDVTLPNGLVDGTETEETIEASFRTTSGGVILGYQTASPESYPYSGWVPELYVGTDGRLYGGSYDTELDSIEQVISSGAVDDGQWHTVALVLIDGAGALGDVGEDLGTMTLYLDGQLVGSVSGSPQSLPDSNDQIGTGFTTYSPAAPAGWDGFVGTIANVRIWNKALTASQIQQDLVTPPAGTAPGLVADYALDVGQGTTAYDLTANQNNGTLMPDYLGNYPTWVIGNASGTAIELGDAGIAANASAPTAGPNNLQNSPVIVTNADGQLQGWLSGSFPDLSFRIDVYASAAYSADGAGQSQEYLGSLEVTTDSQGEAVFDVPFTAPAGLPIVTATATDDVGDTSGLSVERQLGLAAPSGDVHYALDQPLIFTTASDNGIVLQDPDARPLQPDWSLTLSVTMGSLALSETVGLTGSGDGTGSLSYSGSVTALSAALDGMRFIPPAGFTGNATLTVTARSEGADSVLTQVTLANSVFMVTNTSDSGPGSLRQAILDSNSLGGSNTIEFDIPGDGLQTIAPVSPLPPITTPTLLDGSTQPGFAGTPLIVLSGQQIGTADDGLTISGSSVTERDVTVSGFGFSPAGTADVLTIQSSPLPTGSSGSVARYRIDTTTEGTLLAMVQSSGSTTQLSLLDAQGQVLVQSDGVSASNPDDLIDQAIATGTYYLQVTSTGGAGTYTLTATWTTVATPFQPITVGSNFDGFSVPAIAAGDFAGNGRLNLAVVNTSFAGGTVSVLLGNGDGTFQLPVTYTVGPDPDAIVAGDFTGNGRVDLAVADGLSATVWVLLANGDGTFQPPVAYTVEFDADAIVAGDFTGNGRLDLAVADEGFYGDTYGGLVQVLLGNGNGTFQPAVTYAVGSDPGAIVAGDFTGDGRLDLAVSDDSGIQVLLGNGDGTFQPATTVAAGLDGPLVAGDFTGDGRLDLVVADANGIQILLGNGDGTFQPATTIAAGSGNSFVADDFTGDGRLDLAVTNYDGTVSVLLGNGDGTFQPQVTYAVGVDAYAIVAGDFTGDGRLDLAVTTKNYDTVSVLLGDGDGAFQSPSGGQNTVGLGPDAIVAGDFTGDGRLDLAVVNEGSDTVSVLLGNGDGTFQPQVTYAVGSDPDAIVAGDFNGDGRLDLAVVNESSDTVSVLLGNGDGTFQQQVTYAVGSNPDAIVAGDFTGDGHLDLAVANQGPFGLLGNPTDTTGTVSVLLGNGDGTFQQQVTYAVGGELTAIVAGEFTGDGRLDLAVANEGSYDRDFQVIPGTSSVSVLLGNGDGTFQPQVTYAVGSAPVAMVAGDFTGDGRVDLAVVDGGDGFRQPNVDYDGPVGPGGDAVQVLLGNGDGTFQPAFTYEFEFGSETVATAIVAGDFTGDGRVDLAVACEDDIQVLLVNGDGTFQPATTIAAFGATPLVAGDFTGNGRLDFAVVYFYSATVSVLLSNDDGTFSPPGQDDITPMSNPVVADVTGDGTDDVLIVDGSGNILFRRGVPGQPGEFEPPLIVNPGFPSRDIAWIPNTIDGPLLASVDAQDDAVSLYSWRDGGFVWIGSLTTGQLPAQIIAADLNGTGWDDLIVRNAGDGTLTVFFNNQLGSVQIGFDQAFLPPLSIPVGLGVSDVQAIDTNAHGYLDLVVTNELTGQVSVLYNDGDDRFAAPVPYRAGTGLSQIDPGSTPEVTSLDATSGVAAGSLTPGGQPSLVTINPGSNTLDVLANLGGGWSFANPVTIETSSPAEVVRMGDFTGNGIDDLAVLTAQGVSIYLGNGKGGFSSPVTYDAGTDPTGLTVADLLGNGQLDLLVGNVYGDVLILVGNGDGTFSPFEPVKANIALAVADLTGNGALDFVYADQSLNEVTVVYGSPNPSTTNSHVVGNQTTGILAPGAVLLADLNGDGVPDLIVANSGGNNVLVYPGLGNGQFGPPINGTQGFPVGTDPTGLAVADLNGQPDLLVADTGSNAVSVLLGQGSGSSWTMISGPRVQTDAGPVAVAVGRLLGGSQTDLAVANNGADNVQVFPGVGGGFFNDQPGAVKTLSVGQAPSSLFLGNFNGQGQELATLNTESNDGTLITDLKSVRPVTQTFATGGDAPISGFAGDFTGDGFTDLVVGNNGDGQLALLLGGPTGLSVSQTLTSPAVPEPTGLSFVGVADGTLSFYVSTAGTDAATAMAFALSPGASPPEPPSDPGLGAGTGESSSSTLTSATVGSFQQVAQLLAANGTTLSLVAPLFTVSIVPGEFAGVADVEGGAALLANVLPGTGPGSLGQPGRTDRPGPQIEGTDELAPADAESAFATVTPSSLPVWDRIATGLERAWEQVRASVMEGAELAEDAKVGPDSPPNRAAPPAPDAAPSSDRRPSAPLTKPARPAAHAGAADAAIAELDAEGLLTPGHRDAREPQDVRIAAGRGRLALPIVTAAVLITTAAVPQAIRRARKRRQSDRRLPAIGEPLFAARELMID